ncbi:hypothetical protein JYU34_010808 [Plutella xylostella]|uniref:ISXO2-like transposase domain-containing protein n=1 Tax=Plutella xylostella TaxID=51655 RepID=A0ABQ7QFA2_PLUXY|nr:hypothetical protein JYU34_010808 [Plutella xylostella]
MEDKPSSSASKSDSDVSDEEMSESSEESEDSFQNNKIKRGLSVSTIVKALSVLNTDDDGGDPQCRRKKKLTVDEIIKRWNILKVFKRLGTQEQCLQFALDRELLPASRLCRRHKTPMKLQTIGDIVGRFQCTKDICRNGYFSRSDNTFFDGCQMQLRQILQLMYFYGDGFNYEETQRECYVPDRDAPLPLATIALWFRYCREAVVIYQIKHQKEKAKIGGPGRLVKLDESKLEHTTREGGKTRRGHWIIGIIEEGTSDFRVDIFPDNEKNINENMVRLVKKHVIEGSTIRASDWAAYRCLCDHGYAVEVTDDASERLWQVLKRSHKGVEVTDDSILRPWQVVKRYFKGLKERCQYQEDMEFAEWLVERSWRKRMKLRGLDPFEKLIECIQYVYPLKKLI